MEDRKIVDLYWQRDENAIPETAAKFGGYCRTIAYNILSDAEDAEECLNDTWLRAWNTMPTNRPAKLAPYLGKLSRWISLTRLREKTSLKRGGGETELVLDELAEAVDSGADVEKAVELKELNAALRRFLKSLGETERQVFLARYWFIASIAEIAEKFGFSESKVTSMLHRTRKKLLAYLKEEGLC
ncbi:MAG: sigma-70 family RNA polymerase sigma factor [Oscillospiraceae bacterium]|nr:sigma-70 family RNA polymerase sigma factor [Oscillospiraceae bacterium]